MREFEIMDGPNSPTGDWTRRYDDVQGNDNLHDLFARIRVSWYYDPYRTFDWTSDRWYIGDNHWSGFFVTKAEAENLTFEELFYNVSLAQIRTFKRMDKRENLV